MTRPPSRRPTASVGRITRLPDGRGDHRRREARVGVRHVRRAGEDRPVLHAHELPAPGSARHPSTASACQCAYRSARRSRSRRSGADAVPAVGLRLERAQQHAAVAQPEAADEVLAAEALGDGGGPVAPVRRSARRAVGRPPSPTSIGTNAREASRNGRLDREHRRRLVEERLQLRTRGAELVRAPAEQVRVGLVGRGRVVGVGVAPVRQLGHHAEGAVPHRPRRARRRRGCARRGRRRAPRGSRTPSRCRPSRTRPGRAPAGTADSGSPVSSGSPSAAGTACSASTTSGRSSDR